jgi:hypothetical protein
MTCTPAGTTTPAPWGVAVRDEPAAGGHVRGGLDATHSPFTACLTADRTGCCHQARRSPRRSLNAVSRAHRTDETLLTAAVRFAHRPGAHAESALIRRSVRKVLSAPWSPARARPAACPKGSTCARLQPADRLVSPDDPITEVPSKERCRPGPTGPRGGLPDSHRAPARIPPRRGVPARPGSSSRPAPPARHHHWSISRPAVPRLVLVIAPGERCGVEHQAPTPVQG